MEGVPGGALGGAGRAGTSLGLLRAMGKGAANRGGGGGIRTLWAREGRPERPVQHRETLTSYIPTIPYTTHTHARRSFIKPLSPAIRLSASQSPYRGGSPN